MRVQTMGGAQSCTREVTADAPAPPGRPSPPTGEGPLAAAAARALRLEQQPVYGLFREPFNVTVAYGRPPNTADMAPVPVIVPGIGAGRAVGVTTFEGRAAWYIECEWPRPVAFVTQIENTQPLEAAIVAVAPAPLGAQPLCLAALPGSTEVTLRARDDTVSVKRLESLPLEYQRAINYTAAHDAHRSAGRR